MDMELYNWLLVFLRVSAFLLVLPFFSMANFPVDDARGAVGADRPAAGADAAAVSAGETADFFRCSA